MTIAAAFARWVATSPAASSWGWTLVHSLWEFCAVAGILAAVLRLLGAASARARYAAAAGALLALVVLPAVTFRIVSAPTPALPLGSPVFASPAASIPAPFATAGETALAPARPAEGTTGPAVPDLTQWLRPLLPWLVGLWACGVLILSLWHLGGWIALQRLRSLGVSPADPAVRATLSQLALRLSIARPVAILKSALVQTPIVIGSFRPLILVPAAVLAGISPADLEAILAHELAHVRRHDYLINLFQAAIDTLLFYHPAVWWVSRQVRQERENCCDDLAAGICGDRRAYARALVAIEELRPPGNVLVLAATGGDAPLTQRIQRLLGQPNRRAGRRTASIAAVCLSLSALLSPLLLHRVSAQGDSAVAAVLAKPDTDVAATPPKPALPATRRSRALAPRTPAAHTGQVLAIVPAKPAAAPAPPAPKPADRPAVALAAPPAAVSVPARATAAVPPPPHREFSSARPTTAVARILPPPAPPVRSPQRLIAAVRAAPAAAKRVPAVEPAPLPPPVHDDGAGHVVLYDATRLPITLTGPEAQRLMIRAIHQFGETNLRVIYRVSFQPSAMIFTYRSANGNAAGHYLFIYTPIGGTQPTIDPATNHPLLIDHNLRRGDVDLGDRRSYMVFKYGRVFAAGTSVEKGFLGGQRFTLIWDNLADAEDFVRALWVLNSRPKTFDTSVGDPWPQHDTHRL